MPSVSRLAPTCMGIILSTSTIGPLGHMEFSFSTPMEWTSSFPMWGEPAWNTMPLAVSWISIFLLVVNRTQAPWLVNMLKSLGCQQKSLIGHLAFINVVSVTKVCHRFRSSRVSDWFKGAIDFVDVAEVISKHAAANIPLETMWTDIGGLHLDRILIYLTEMGRLHGQATNFHYRSSILPSGQNAWYCRLPALSWSAL